MKILPAKRLILNLISVSLLTSITLGAIVLVLKNPLNVLNAQTNPTSYWNVERDGGNNLNFSFTNNGAGGTVGLQLLPSGLVTSNTQITAKQGFTTGYANLDSTMTGQRPYQFGYQEGGAWTTPFPDLILGYHTGVKIGGNFNYGGVKVFNDHPSMTGAVQLLSVGDGDNNVRIANDLLFPNAGYGIKSPTNTAGLIPNNLSYGSWRVSGSRNGWGGIEFDAPTTPATQATFMVGNPAHSPANMYTGMHLNGSGWLWYGTGHDLHAGDATVANGNIPAMPAGNMFANIFYDKTNTGYYLDPAGASNLNGATFASGPTTNDWFRVNGNNGLYFQSFGGGWHMIDATFLRSYGNKPILVPYITDQDHASYYVDPHATSNVNQINATTIHTPTTGSYFPHPNTWNYIRGNSYIAGDTGVILANGNVGIGTTAPQGKLGVGFGNGDQVIFNQINDDGLGIQTTLNGQPNNGYGGHSNNRLTLQPTTGYVGIKATYPTADLHIKQSDQSQWGGGGIKLERSSSGYARIFMGDDQQLYFFTNSNSHYCLVAINGSIPCASDSRLKKDIEPLTISALEVLGKLKPRTYTWKDGGMHSAGFIAQEVEGILPEAVTRNNENGYYALSDAYFTPYIVKSIQELDAKFATTNAEVKALNEQVKSQQQEIELLKKEMAEVKDLLGVKNNNR